MNTKTTINQKQEVCFYHENLPQLKIEEEEDDKPELKPNKMLYENVFEYIEIYQINIKEVSCLSVAKIAQCNP